MAAARLMSPSEFGRLSVLQITVMLLAGIAGLGLGISLTRQVAASAVSTPTDTGNYIGLGLVLTLIAGATTTAIYILVRSEVATRILQEPGATSVVIASAGAVFFTAMATNSQGALLGLEAFRSTAISQWSLGLGVGVSLIIGTWIGGLQGAMGGLSIGSSVGAAVSAALLIRELSARDIPIVWIPKKGVWQSLWRPAVPAFVAFLVVALALLLGQLALTREADGYAEAGIFNLAYRWHIAVLFLPAVAAPALLPTLTRLLTEGKHGGSRRVFQTYGAGTLLLTVPPAIAVMLAAGPLLSLSGAYYAEHPWPLVILALASIPSAANNVLSTGALGLGAIRAWLLSDIALAAVLLGGAVLLVPAQAATGLAVAYLLAYVVTDAILVYPVRRLFRTRPAPPP
jgi:O-antigen/teichoic acid export membrane protein